MSCYNSQVSIRLGIWNVIVIVIFGNFIHQNISSFMYFFDDKGISQMLAFDTPQSVSATKALQRGLSAERITREMNL